MSYSKRISPWLLLPTLCSGLVFWVLRYGLRYRYQTICRNMTSALPAKKPAEITHLLNSYYRHLSDLCVEPFLLALAPTSLRDRLARFTNLDLLHRLHRAQKPVVLLASHYGNWEYLIQLPLHSPYPVYTAYSPPRTPWVNRLLFKVRKRFGIHLIPQQTFYRYALTHLRQTTEPSLVVLVADQRPGPASLKHQLMFLQQPTFVQLGAERLAQELNAAVVVVDCIKVGRFCYEYRFELLDWHASEAQPLALTRLYYQHLSEQINQSPAYWLWSHNRWKGSTNAPEQHRPLTAQSQAGCGQGAVEKALL